MNTLLEDLFAQARVEVPQRSYDDTKKTFLTGLAVGGASIIGLKVITSSILKSKFFIMSISAVSILTSAVLVYTAAVKPTQSVADHQTKPSTEVFEANTPMGSALPPDLFVEQNRPTLLVEPDDSLDVEKTDTVANLEAIILKTIDSIDMEAIEIELARAVESLKEIDIEVIEGEVAELRLMLEKMQVDSLIRFELANTLRELEAEGVKLNHDIDRNRHEARVMVLSRETVQAPKLTRKVFTITDKTTDLDLEAFNKEATEAGIDVRYDCRVWAGKVKKLNMRCEINTDNGEQIQDIHIKNVKRNETFAFNIVWYENASGEAVYFNKTEKCENEQHNHNCEEH
ncbi:MAG: hypothetical protein R3279_06565 [Putridiphycobacter sp.]|nr:hypothetical protein [Putridiphycobacter sp.]